MKILDRYIARQLLGVTALGVMALSALLLLGNLFKELRPLLVENKAPISIVLEFIFQVIPFSLMFSIPWGFLTAVLLVYGRLASDNELTSMRMSGMSLWRLSAPAIAIGIALSGLCYWINIDIAPRANSPFPSCSSKPLPSTRRGFSMKARPLPNSTTWKSTSTNARTTSSTACIFTRKRTKNPRLWPCTRNA